MWFLANLISAIINFFAVVFFSRTLGAAVFGIYILFFTTVQVLNFLGNGGISTATIKRISEGNSSPSLLGTSLFMRTVLLIILSCGILIYRSQLSDYLNGDYAYPLIIILFLLQFSDLFREVLQGFHRVGTSAIIDLVQQVGKVGFQVGLIGYGVFGLIIGLIIGVIMSIGCGYSLIRIKISFPQRSDFLLLFKFSKFAYGNALGGLVYDWIGILAIGFFVGSAVAAIYSVCWSISVMVLLFSQAIASTLLPHISSFSVKENVEDVRKILGSSLSYSSFLAIPSFFGVMAIGNSLLSIVYGNEFTVGASTLIILMATRVIQSFQMVITRTLEGIDRPDVEFKITIVTLMINIMMMIALIPYYGAIGAAVSAFVTILVSLILNAFALNRFIPLFITSTIIWIIGGSIIMEAGIIIFKYLYPVTSLGTLICVILVGMLIYGAILIFNSEIRGYLNYILPDLRFI